MNIILKTIKVKKKMNNRPVRILYVNGGLMDRGGVSSVMMNYFLRFDPELIHIDFLVHGSGTGERDQEILEQGSKVIKAPPKSKNPVTNIKIMKRVIKKGNYDIVHAHADSGNAHILKIAKQCGVPIRISHSHNTNYTINNKVRIFFNELQKKELPKYATHMWACSKAAARWLYGNNENVEIIHNAIDVDMYRFSDDFRTEIRQKYNIEDKYVVGIVGRMDHQKNHKLIIDVLSYVKEKEPDVCLLIVGDGILKKDLADYVKLLKLTENVIFCGKIDQVCKYYSAMDLFVMPSLFEGLPVSAVEAQCAGLPCLLSDRVTEEVKILNSVEYLSIDNINIWKNKIIVNSHNSEKISRTVEIASDSGFDISKEVQKLQNRYRELAGERR